MSDQDQASGKTVQPPTVSRDITELERVEEALRKDHMLLEAIHHAQTQFILAEDPLGFFGEFLKSLLTLTDSEYGFIDEMFYTEDGQPFLTARAITDISWNDESRTMYQQFVDGTLNFSNLNSLYGVVMSSGKPLIANDAANDPRRTGIPSGHPPLKAFLGLPLLSYSNEFVGMIGLANRPGGYNDEVITYLEPMVVACANLIGARKNDQRRRQAEQELQQHREQLAAALARSKEELQFAYVAAHEKFATGADRSSIVRETGDELAGIEGFDDAMDLWARQARYIVGAHQSAVSYIPHSNFAEGKHAISMSAKYDKYQTYDVLPNGDGIWALIAKEKLSLCMTDEELNSHPGWKKFSDLRDERGLEHPPMRGWLAVPILRPGGDFVGVLQLTDKYEGDFTQDDLRRLTRLAQLMAPAFSLQFANEELQRHSQELSLAQRELEQSNVDLQQFAYIASHDLQTPLRGIAGFAQFLQRDYQGKLDEKADEYIERIVEGAKRMQQLINDLLTYSRVESRSRSFEPTDLNKVFDDAVAILHSSIQDSGGEVTRAELPTVIADYSQLSQLLQNLIGNGLKYHGDRPPRVHVSAKNGDSEWTVAVRDNGIGIAVKHHERIFEIFRRLHTEQEYPGTGIGLAVCQRIVLRHGGRIWLESEPGKGSTFYFSIPVPGSKKQE